MKESFDWIDAAIQSCTNSFPIDCCYRFIELFKTKYGEGKEERELIGILEEQKSFIGIDV